MTHNYFSVNELNFINLLSETIDKLIKRRKTIYSTSYYMYHIYYVLKTGIPWNALSVECHYTSVYKHFIKYNKFNVFSDLYLDHINKYLDCHKINTCYIDSTHIKNINGSDLIGRNHYDRFRHSTKLHTIIDDNNIPINYKFTAGNVNDSKLTEKLITEKIDKLVVDKRRIINLIGDKGYFNDKLKKELIEKRVQLIVPVKKNIKRKQTANENKKLLLSNRLKIEHFFGRLDKFKRISVRYERLSSQLIAFHLIAFIFIIFSPKFWI